MDKSVYKQGKQFVWEEDSQSIRILFLEMYFRYFYIFSSRAAEYPKLIDKNVQIHLSKSKLTINFINFQIPIFDGLFTDKILVDESYWKIDTKKGILFNLSKSQDDKIWNTPFSQYNKELLYENLLFENHQDFQAILNENPSISKQFLEQQKHQNLQNIKFTIELTKRNFPKEMWEKKFDDQYKQLMNIPKEYVSFSLNNHREMMFKDVLKKNSIFQEQGILQMKLGMIDCTYYAVMEKTFILVKLIRNAIWTGSSLGTLIEDPLQNVIKLYIYNYDQKSIQKGTWLLIQEPLTKPGSTDAIPMIRVDNPKDLIMQVDQKIIQLKLSTQINTVQFKEEIQQRISKIHQEEDYALVYEVNQQEQLFSFVIFEEQPSFAKRGLHIFIEQSKDNWIGAKIIRQTVKTDNFIAIELEQNDSSTKFLNQISLHYLNTPGKFIMLWRPYEISVQGFLEKILISNSMYSVENFNNLISIWYLYYESESKNPIEDACDLWIHNQNALTTLKSKKNKNNKINESQAKSYKENIAYQIQEILDQYDKIKSEQSNINLNNLTFESIKYEAGSFSQQQLLLKQEEVQIDKKQILTNLLNEKDIHILELSLFHLNNFLNAEQFIKNTDKLISIQEYSDIVLLKKISPGEFNMNSTIKALELIKFGYNQQIIDKINLKKKKKKENRKNKKKLKQKQQILENLTNQLDQDIKVVTGDEQTEQEVEQFQYEKLDDNINQQNNLFEEEEEEDSDQEEEQDKIEGSLTDKSIQKMTENVIKEEQKNSECTNLMQTIDDEFDNFSETNSVKSLLTVHSRLQGQKSNNHWKDRLQERSSIEISDQKVKEQILKEIKEALKKGGSKIIQSKENPERFLVKDISQGIQFVLQKFKGKEKDIYVPITILNLKMKFK